MIAQIGSYVAGIHIIRRGVVSSCIAALRDGANPCCILGPGDLVGLEALSTREDRVSSSQLRAVTEVELDFLTKDEIHASLAESAGITRYVMGRVMSQYYLMQETLDATATDEDVVCQILLQLATASGLGETTGRVELPRPIDRAALCDLSGLSARRLRRALAGIASLSIEKESVSFEPEDARRRLQPNEIRVPRTTVSPL
jgi:CRP-like cAMP-binding protein